MSGDGVRVLASEKRKDLKVKIVLDNSLPNHSLIIRETTLTSADELQAFLQQVRQAAAVLWPKKERTSR